jgi:NADPH:quinone reductase-like Zn-dependent oxidoreductase
MSGSIYQRPRALSHSRTSMRTTTGDCAFHERLIPYQTTIEIRMNIVAHGLNAAYLAADTMKAIGVTAKPEISKVSERLEMLEVTTPRPEANQVAIRLCASAMHIDEIYAAQGTSLGRFFGPKKVSTDNPYILGSSVSGVVVDVGEKADKLKIGDEVIDYTKHEFGDYLREKGNRQDAVFDCIGGRDTERNAFRALKPTGVFATVVGPKKYVGERKLSWWEFGKLMSYIGFRMFITRLKGPRYVFAAKLPRLVINDAMSQVVENDIHMPVQQVVPFELSSIRDAVSLLTTHRAKGRIVIDFAHTEQ